MSGVTSTEVFVENGDTLLVEVKIDDALRLSSKRLTRGKRSPDSALSFEGSDPVDALIRGQEHGIGRDPTQGCDTAEECGFGQGHDLTVEYGKSQGHEYSGQGHKNSSQGHEDSGQNHEDSGQGHKNLSLQHDLSIGGDRNPVLYTVGEHNTTNRNDCTTRLSHNGKPVETFYLDRSVIGSLNNQYWNEKCLEALNIVCSKHQLASNVVTRSGSHQVADATSSSNQTLNDSDKSQGRFKTFHLTSDFTLLPIQALTLFADKACILEQSLTNQELYARLLTANGISPERLTFKTGDHRCLEDMNNDWSVVVVDVVESSGCLRQHILEDIALARSV